MGQKLRGFVGQGVGGGKKLVTPLSYAYGPGSYVLTPIRSGWYRFVLWGAGGTTNGGNVASGGALVVADRYLPTGGSVAIVVGQCTLTSTSDSTLTLPTGELIVAGAGQTGIAALGGIAVGNAAAGDILVNAPAAPGTGVPGSAASFGRYIGGIGATSKGDSPGAGSATNLLGGSGLVLVHQVRSRF